MSSRHAFGGLFTDLPTRKLNRLHARLPKSGRFWCGCDARLVSEGRKCSSCGVRIGVRRMRMREVR